MDMHKYIATEAAKKQDDCCLEAAIANWTLCNLYAGCRGVEWMQTDSTNSDPISYHRNRFGNAYAFTPRDVQCATVSNQLLSISEAIASPHHVGCIRLRFEKQKNGENGEKKLFVRNPKDPSICFVTHFMHILCRHHTLV